MDEHFEQTCDVLMAQITQAVFVREALSQGKITRDQAVAMMAAIDKITQVPGQVQ